MLSRFRVIRYIVKLYLFIAFKFNPIKTSRKLGVQIGKDCVIYGNTPAMWGTEPFLIKMGNNVHITDNCKFITHDGGTLILRQYTPDLEYTAPIEIGNNVYIGLETLILPGVKIGNNVIIGARSIITKDIPNNSVVVGSPAKVIKSVDDYYENMKSKSLKIGHLKGDAKAEELRKIFADFINN